MEHQKVHFKVRISAASARQRVCSGAFTSLFQMASDDLYILRCPGHYGTWKVGRSHCLARRLLEFNRHVVCPYELEQVYIGCGVLEVKLHRALAAYRVETSMSREFFQCDLRAVLTVADALVEQARSAESWDHVA